MPSRRKSRRQQEKRQTNYGGGAGQTLAPSRRARRKKVRRLLPHETLADTRMFAERRQQLREAAHKRRIAQLKAAIGTKDKYYANERRKKAEAKRADFRLIAGDPDMDRRSPDPTDCAKRKARKRVMFAIGKAGKNHHTTKPYKPPGGKC